MSISWNTISNGDTMLSIREELNRFAASVVSAVNGLLTTTSDNTTDIEALYPRVTATEDIGTTNAANIVAVADDLADYEAAHTFDYTTGTSITVASTTYESVLTLDTPSREAGVYVLTQAMLYSLDSTNNSAYFRFTINGGASWTEIRRESKDNTDLVPASFSKVIVHTGGVMNFEIQAKKEAINDSLIIHDISLILDGKE